MNPNRIIKKYTNAQAVAEGFAEDFANWAKAKETVHVALSGGSTPKILFKLWADSYRNRIDWTNIHFYWGDERCVPPDHEQSNFKMTNELLFQYIDIPQENIHRIRGEDIPQEEANRYSEEVKNNVAIQNNWPIFDMIILGMGADGHTASIFPHEIELLNSDKICEVATHPESGQRRVTLTGKVLNLAEKVCFLITGGSKTEVLSKILEEKEDWQVYPTSHILPQGDLEFYVDDSAIGA